ncbi:MAG: dihydropteroate synthase [Deltaproteobacteria bacterium]|nr:dihydropteroate synthase [Deltaproteobacteria bacterium]
MLSHHGTQVFIQSEAKAQVEVGADYLDVNAGSFIGEEAKHLRWVIEVAQDAIDCPICSDSPDPEVIKSALPLVKKSVPMINSIRLGSAHLEDILHLKRITKRIR